MTHGAATVLDVWEAGLAKTPAARAVLLLQAAGEQEFAQWTVGQRDSALLRHYFVRGQNLDALADCPACGVALELALDPEAFAAPCAASAVRVEHEGYAVTARHPTVADLLELPQPDEEAQRQFLLGRCVLEATRHGDAVQTNELPDDVVALVEQTLDDTDPAADIRISLTCGECATTWSETLDPVRFAWSAVEATARRLATEVHTLAHAYGWSEREILRLSAFRRHLYLSAVTS